jgi:hypothetical protein
VATLQGMRDIATIDSDLRLASRRWRAARVLSGQMPSTALIDRLLDERSAAAQQAPILVEGCSLLDRTARVW